MPLRPSLLTTFLLSLIFALASLAVPRLAALSRQMTSAEAPAPLKNVVVVGGSYVGLATAKELIESLPATHRVVVVEKQSHFGHLFAYPRRGCCSRPYSRRTAS
jgi:NADPH-dependent 2,4-dienoyl-CoA reductase/sulfur reductase-like enzyme